MNWGNDSLALSFSFNLEGRTKVKDWEEFNESSQGELKNSTRHSKMLLHLTKTRLCAASMFCLHVMRLVAAYIKKRQNYFPVFSSCVNIWICPSVFRTRSQMLSLSVIHCLSVQPGRCGVTEWLWLDQTSWLLKCRTTFHSVSKHNLQTD